ncbi:hypothetical protein PV371_36850 [Streptomyces sp. TX20-6-3]|uniref:hypothetical protein n=1 Tax=Streptomyces sp. TX20-6-3 TaxID=3028705 RepID=UPI0029AA061D|nr:hypothetical protein [Streptomyces sp. TX20-6-3]MDX2565191.1 hypothetical protein [Streptomyces sp. TX20-6-3]
MPSPEDVFSNPDKSGKDPILPLLRLDLDSVIGGRGGWPPVAYILGCHVYNYDALKPYGGPWVTFSCGENGLLNHRIPKDSLFRDDLLSSRDREDIAKGAGGEAEDIWWTYKRLGSPGYAVMDRELGLPDGATRGHVYAYEKGKLALGGGIEATQIDATQAERVWEEEVGRGLGVGMIASEPIWREVGQVVPRDSLGCHMAFVGQFRADAITAYIPGFTLWLYWSAATGEFAQLDSLC